MARVIQSTGQMEGKQIPNEARKMAQKGKMLPKKTKMNGKKGMGDGMAMPKKAMGKKSMKRGSMRKK